VHWIGLAATAWFRCLSHLFVDELEEALLHALVDSFDGYCPVYVGSQGGRLGLDCL